TRLPVPVVVVGNVMAGGTGKTPVVISLVEYFKSQGWRVGVIARAYGSPSESVQEVSLQSSSLQVGDEPLLLKHRCDVPVFVGRERSKAALALLKAYPNTHLIVSDDGMQHLALWHDIALCVFDDRGSGNGWLLPAGPLREPWPSSGVPGVARHVLYTGKQHPDGAWAAKRSLAMFARNGSGEQRHLSEWAGQPIQALAAIAKPDAFFHSLAQAGMQLEKSWPLPDHADLSQWQTDSPLPIFCTEKDAVKLWPHQPQAWAISLNCDLPASLLDTLALNLQQLSSSHGQKTA
ncbi:MAG: tetraacyldisaccharide 4'-kinase, partial [Limnohabitans sp.]